MSTFMQELPTLLILSVLVATFYALRRHSGSRRIRYWIFAWALILLHFFAEAFKPHLHLTEAVQQFGELAALELSGIVFLVSLTPFAKRGWRGPAVLGMLSFPVSLHAAGVAFGWQAPAALAAAVGAAFFLGALLPVFLRLRLTARLLALEIVLVGAGAWAALAQLHGDPDRALIAILAVSFGLCGVFYWDCFPRATLGVLTVTSGFLIWGGVFPAAYTLQRLLPQLQVDPDLWNVPKFVVAFGMILALLENQSQIIEQARAREHAENALLERLSRLTSQMLAGKDPAALAGEIAETITATTGFAGAAVLLADGQGRLRLAGSSGYERAELEALGRLTKWSFLEAVPRTPVVTPAFGRNSFRVRSGPGPLAGGREEGSCGESGEELVIPLESSQGSCLGYILLSPLHGLASASSIIANLEMLAGDLAVTLENARLHSQLVRAEKLASLGQLVAGVAHELNNPLTVVMGYADLLSGEAKAEPARTRLERLGQQARRMKRIVEGLLRFARKGNSETSAAAVEPALRDVLELREHDIRTRNIELHVEIEPNLPAAATGGDELRQVFLNLLNNAVDAVEESRERIILIGAKRRDERIVVRFEDTGPGFADPNRAFDPFYTTKPVGQGTGLGLSICYGIVRKCGGQIHLANNEPYGASVRVELPTAQETVCLQAR